MKALLLAAGYGRRLRPLTEEIPKCLVPIKGKPLLEYWLELLVESGITDILINLHYRSERVEDYINESRYKEYITAVYEQTLLGTAGTLLQNRVFFKGHQILLIHADNLSFFKLASFVNAHNSRPGYCDITMMTFETEFPESCGIVELDKNNVVKAFHEKVENPPGRLANGAVYILEQSIFKFLENIGKEEIDFSTEVLPAFTGKIYTFHNDNYHRDIGTMESYEKAQYFL